ncbi:unnamed protein product [Peronospora farinosa]|uniref:Calcineurin-like phosphoesterase domain-containing protein n=1 Tax=Peronospora farinosa TaxID=134698 RepID=A0ABN8CK26_9STRA|nr:unnamed protein product [Peronospora farinosa]
MESACRDINGTDETVGRTMVRHILHLSDVHLNISNSLNDSDSIKIPIAYGDDAPMSLLVSALDCAKKLLPNPDFFLYTGDHVVHGELSDEYLVKAVEKNVETMARYYSTLDSDMMLDITAIIGNTDTSPDYTMKVTNPQTENNSAIALISSAWKKTMSKSNLEWFNHCGYLAYALDDNLTVLTLNTLPYSPSHLPYTSNVPDQFEQFTWLNATFGSPMWNETYIKTYKWIVSQYTDIIKAQFFGHIHSIEFRLPLTNSLSAQFQQYGVTVNDDYADSSELVPLFMAAAISPMFLNNPAFMVWDFDDTIPGDYEACVSSTKASKLKRTSIIQHSSTSSSTGSLLYASTILCIVGGMAAAVAFALLTCRRNGDQEASKLLQHQRVQFAAIV